tara:strand:- start:3919 stop:4329 length:411 start_codon:yes stop_codon:yes gene_type:complete
MTIQSKYQILPDVNIVFIERIGKFDPGTMLSTFKEILGDPEFATGMNFLVDSRQVDYGKANFVTLSGQKKAWSLTHKNMGSCKVAFLQQDATNYGISRQATSLFFSDVVERQPFLNKSEALEWLGLPADTKLPDLF